MNEVVVIQSHGAKPGEIVARATASVQQWASRRGYAYRFEDDALFERLPHWVVPKVTPRMQMAADVARLLWISELLDEGWARVIWLDADVLVFRSETLTIAHEAGYAFGREFWVVPDGQGGVKLHRNVHNAVLMFTPEGRATLDFYAATALRLLHEADMSVPPQFVGPKLLTALHNVVNFPTTDAVGMASPLVLDALAAGGGHAWTALCDAHGAPLAAINLCASMFGRTVDGVTLSERLVVRALENLVADA